MKILKKFMVIHQLKNSTLNTILVLKKELRLMYKLFFYLFSVRVLRMKISEFYVLIFSLILIFILLLCFCLRTYSDISYYVVLPIAFFLYRLSFSVGFLLNTIHKINILFYCVPLKNFNFSAWSKL